MKKRICATLAFLLCLGALTVFTACGHEHTWKEEWAQDKTHHWRVCENEECDVTDQKEEHTWDGGKVISQPTADEYGQMLYKCTVCGKAKTERISANLKVSAEEWERALSYAVQAAGSEDYVIVADSANERPDGEKTDLRTTFCRVGGDVWITTLNPNLPSESATISSTNTYYTAKVEQEQTKYYCYEVTFAPDENGEATQRISTSEITQDAYDLGCNRFDLSKVFSYDSFTFDSASAQYTAERIETEGVIFTNVAISFVDGKVTAYSYTMEQTDVVTMTVNAQVKYDAKTAIVFPDAK